MQELIDNFSLERVSKSGARFQPDKAKWFNAQYLSLIHIYQAYHITEACLQIEGGGNSRIPNDIAILGVDNDETICKLSAPNLSSLSQGVEQGERPSVTQRR